MILEKETYEKFGYYPSNLKPFARKTILAACDDCGKIRAIRRSLYRGLCIACAKKGKRHPLFGLHRTEETKKKIREGNKGKQITEEHMKKLRKARNLRPTQPELIFERICQKYKLPYKYTGDSSFWIGHNPALNPDFIHLTEKIIVEIFGDYWHSPLWNYKIKDMSILPNRKKLLKKYRWDLVVIWERDLLRRDAEEFVLSLLKKENAL